jgi:uncharacterized protein (TIGR02453 family)
MTFAGFPRQGLRFLEDLLHNNERTWFQANRDTYEQKLLEPARDFVEALGAELAGAGVDAHADPRVGGSIMRINRDTRFSRDKRPYKTHLDLWFWQGSRPSRESPGFWFRLTPKQLILGAGMHRFERPLLERYRQAVVDKEHGRALTKAVRAVERAGYEVGGRNYKRVPAGFDAQHERAELLLHNGLYAGREFELPQEVHSAAFPRFCAKHYRKLAPLNAWLLELTGSSAARA